jgi:hypothetical protein
MPEENNPERMENKPRILDLRYFLFQQKRQTHFIAKAR